MFVYLFERQVGAGGDKWEREGGRGKKRRKVERKEGGREKEMET